MLTYFGCAVQLLIDIYSVVNHIGLFDQIQLCSFNAFMFIQLFLCQKLKKRKYQMLIKTLARDTSQVILIIGGRHLDVNIRATGGL